jgi:hypothetical protein
MRRPPTEGDGHPTLRHADSRAQVCTHRGVSIDGKGVLNIFELAKFTVLLQKETDTLHSDTQIHELRCELRQVLV